jgi:hypothetical protein
MPVDSLTPEQRARYGRYGDDPTPEQLARCFHLTNDDRELIDKGQSDRARLGCAVQLGTVRFLGTFLADQTDVPTVVVDHLTAQLGISDPSALKGYSETAMRFKHAAAIQERFGYSDFNDQPGHLRFVRWLYTRSVHTGLLRGLGGQGFKPQGHPHPGQQRGCVIASGSCFRLVQRHAARPFTDLRRCGTRLRPSPSRGETGGYRWQSYESWGYPAGSSAPCRECHR